MNDRIRLDRANGTYTLALPSEPLPMTREEVLLLADCLLRAVQADQQPPTRPQEVAALLLPELAPRLQESLVVLLLSSKMRLLKKLEVYQGTVDSSLVRPAEVFRPAVVANAPHIIVVHNHPSGDPSPSEHDIRLTRQLFEAGKLLEIELLDHVIVAQGGFVSLKDKGLGFT